MPRIADARGAGKKTEVLAGKCVKARTRARLHHRRCRLVSEVITAGPEAIAAPAAETIVATVESRAERCLEARYRETEEQATDDWQRVAQERAMRPRREWKRLAVWLRRQRAARANRSGHRALSQCLRRGAGECYTGSTLAEAAKPSELELAQALEERFVTIRRIARNISRFRVAVGQHAKLVREIAERCSRGEDSCESESLRGRTRLST